MQPVDPWRDITLTLLSTFGFLTLRFILPHATKVPEALLKDKNARLYNWFNVLVSLCHSFITGTWCLLCFYRDPKMAEDLIQGHDEFSHTLVAVSTGYFIYDIIDNLLWYPWSHSWEILLHHTVVTICFGVAVLLHIFVGYAVVALLVEVNSVPLHLRQLFRMSHFPRDSRVYKLNCAINIATFVIFRIFTLAYMTYWLVIHRDDVPWMYHIIGSVGMFVMTIMNIILFGRLLKKDFGQPRKTDQCPSTWKNHTRNGNGILRDVRNGAANHAKSE